MKGGHVKDAANTRGRKKRIQKAWGHTAHRGLARLLLNRARYLIIDGMNDAPALKRADMAVAVHGATDSARAAADIVLTRPGLSTILDATMISRSIFQCIKNFLA